MGVQQHTMIIYIRISSKVTNTSILVREKMYLNMSKRDFGKTYLIYIGYIVGDGELKIDPSKVEFIEIWSKPKNVSDVRSFLGATQY